MREDKKRQSLIVEELEIEDEDFYKELNQSNKLQQTFGEEEIKEEGNLTNISKDESFNVLDKKVMTIEKNKE